MKEKLLEIIENKQNVFFIKLPIALGLLIVSLLSFLIVYNAQWVFGDQFGFLLTTASGKFYSMSNDVGVAGRFFPLGHQDLNIIPLLGVQGTATVHFIWSTLNYLVFSVIVFLFIKRIIKAKSANWLALFGLLFLSARFYPMFLDLIFPERIILVLLSVFLYLYYQFVQTNQIKYGILSFLIAVYLSYCKEPLSGMFAVMALTHLFFNYKQLSKTHRIFYIGLLVNLIVFIVLYYFIVFQFATGFYGQTFVGFSKLELIISVFRSHKILLFGVLLVIYRLYFIILKKEKEHLLFDGIAFSAFSYVFVLVFLNMKNTYYYFPAIFFIYISLVYFLSNIVRKEIILLSIFAISTMIVVVKVPSYIKQIQIARKNTMPQMQILANYVKEKKVLYWYVESSKVNDVEYQILSGWEKIVTESFIGYVLQDDFKFKLQTISNIDQLNKDNCLLYTHRSDINNKISNRISEAKLNSLTLGNIIVYSKSGLE